MFLYSALVPVVGCEICGYSFIFEDEVDTDFACMCLIQSLHNHVCKCIWLRSDCIPSFDVDRGAYLLCTGWADCTDCLCYDVGAAASRRLLKGT